MMTDEDFEDVLYAARVAIDVDHFRDRDRWQKSYFDDQLYDHEKEVLWEFLEKNLPSAEAEVVVTALSDYAEGVPYRNPVTTDIGALLEGSEVAWVHEVFLYLHKVAHGYVRREGRPGWKLLAGEYVYRYACRFGINDIENIPEAIVVELAEQARADYVDQAA